MTAAAYRASLPKKRGRPEMLEVQQPIVAWLRDVFPGCTPQATKNEAAPKSKNPHARARYFAEREKDGHNDGFPDLCVFGIGDGRIPPLVECKVPGGEVTWTQQVMHQRLLSRGQPVIVATCRASCLYGLRRYGYEPLETPGLIGIVPDVRYQRRRLPADPLPDFGAAA